MGYVGDGAAALKRNHAMIRGSGHTFKKVRKFGPGKGKSVKVNEDRMAVIAKNANQRELIKLLIVLAIVIAFALVLI